MKPWGRFLFIFIAYSMALLHTAVPHHHAQAGDGKTVFVHKGCVLLHGQGSLLQKVFSTDLGIGHLEKFKKSSDTEIKFSSRFIALVVFSPVIDRVVSGINATPGFLSGHIEKLTRQRLLFAITSFRAPPVP